MIISSKWVHFYRRLIQIGSETHCETVQIANKWKSEWKIIYEMLLSKDYTYIFKE